MGSVNRFFKAPSRSFFLFGPRGTGKSTWIKSSLSNRLHIDLLDPGLQRQYNADPNRLKNVVDAEPHQKTIVIDEIQKAPELLSVVHGLIEENKERRFILTGSSSRKLKRTGVDLLGGRASVETMHPFLAAELGKEFDFSRALDIGLIPLIWQDTDPHRALQGYVDLYLKEEVQQEGIIRNLSAFSKFLESISFSNGSVLNMANIARECHVDQKSIVTYVSILEDLLLAFRLPVFSKRAKRETSQHPKFYFFDVGVFRSLRPIGPVDQSGEFDGQALETLVAQHLRAWIAYGDRGQHLYFWRTRSGVEVDFVIYGKDTFWAIEVKNSTRMREEDLRGLRAFIADYPEAKGIFLYRGQEKLKRHGILCVPCEEFLLELKP